MYEANERTTTHNWANCQKPAKNEIQKFVKLTDRTCACNVLTNFECEVQATGNGSYVNLQKLLMENLVKSPWANLYLADF